MYVSTCSQPLFYVQIGQMDNYFSVKFSGVVNCSFACVDKNSVRSALEYTWAPTIPHNTHKHMNI